MHHPLSRHPPPPLPGALLPHDPRFCPRQVAFQYTTLVVQKRAPAAAADPAAGDGEGQAPAPAPPPLPDGGRQYWLHRRLRVATYRVRLAGGGQGGLPVCACRVYVGAGRVAGGAGLGCGWTFISWISHVCRTSASMYVCTVPNDVRRPAQ